MSALTAHPADGLVEPRLQHKGLPDDLAGGEHASFGHNQAQVGDTLDAGKPLLLDVADELDVAIRDQHVGKARAKNRHVYTRLYPSRFWTFRKAVHSCLPENDKEVRLALRRFPYNGKMPAYVWHVRQANTALCIAFVGIAPFELGGSR